MPERRRRRRRRGSCGGSSRRPGRGRGMRHRAPPRKGERERSRKKRQEGNREKRMSLSDELNRLAELRQRGVLSDEEFARAKGRLLYGEGLQAAAPLNYSVNTFRRSRNDRWI